MGSILGSKGNKGSNSSSGSSSGIGRSGNFQGSYSTTGTQFSDQLGQFLNQQMGASGDYSKEAAINDVNGVLANQAQTALKSVMPNIARNINTSGAYDSTTKQLMQNDAQAQIVGQLANTQLQAIKDYGTISNQNLSSMANLFNAGQVSESGSFGLGFNNSNNQSTQQSSGSTSGGGSGLLGLFADGGTVPTPDSGGGGFFDGMDMSQFAGAFLDASTGGMFKAVSDAINGDFNAKTLLNLIRAADGKAPINWDDPVKKSNPEDTYDSTEWLLDNIGKNSPKSGIGTPVVVKGQ